MFARSPDMIFFLDGEGRIFDTNTQAEPVLRYSPGALEQRPYLEMLMDSDIAQVKDRFANVMAGGVERFETRLKDIDGAPRDFEILAFPVVEGGKTVGALGFARDIAKQKALEAAMHEMAYHDFLTGLPNQRAMQQHLEELVRADLPFAVMLIDLDRFKTVNDKWGHEAGDTLLKSVTARLGDRLPLNAKLYRYGGDELVAVMQTEEEAETVGFAELLQARFEEPFALPQRSITVSASIGIATYPEDGVEIDTLFSKADNAMYFSKRHGRNTFALYRETGRGGEHQRVHLEIELRDALRRGEIYAVYQPQVDLATGRAVGAEALMRWRHPQLGEVNPEEFIPVAEESGLIAELGAWILATACSQAASWQASGRGPAHMSVNLSMHQLAHDDLVATLQRVLGETRASPARLTLEITESVVAEPEIVLGQLEGVKRLGVTIAVDDFGTGYSSLRTLRDYPVDHLKIDQSFVSEMEQSKVDRDLVEAVIELAHTIGLRTVAEGIETEGQLRLLSERGADLGQGYYFARPMPAAELEAWYAQA